MQRSNRKRWSRGLSIPLVASSIALTMVMAACRNGAERHFQAAQQAATDEDYEQAVRLFREVTISWPESPLAPRAHYRLAEIYYFITRDVDGAFTNLTAVLTSYGESDQALPARQLLARLYEEDLGQPERALVHYRRLLEENLPLEARREVLLSQGNCQFRLNQLEESASTYRQAIALPYDPASDAAYLRLASLSQLQGAYEESLVLLEELLTRSGSDEHRYRASLDRAELLLRLGRWEDAAQALASARAEFPDDTEILAMAERLEEEQLEQQPLDSEAQAGRLEELQKKIRWGAGRRRRSR